MHYSPFSRCLCAALTCLFLCWPIGSVCLAADHNDGAKSVDPADAKAIQWLSYEAGLARAKAEHKKAFIYFYTNRCHYCNIMEKTTLADNRIVDLLSDQFVSIKINLEETPALASVYFVSGVPSSWFLESSGEKIGGRPGYLAPEMFAELLNLVIDEKYK